MPDGGGTGTCIIKDAAKEGPQDAVLQKYQNDMVLEGAELQELAFEGDDLVARYVNANDEEVIGYLDRNAAPWLLLGAAGLGLGLGLAFGLGGDDDDGAAAVEPPPGGGTGVTVPTPRPRNPNPPDEGEVVTPEQ